ncbi:ATP-dependent RNA helicase HelY [Raineyella antarctica]|uniref:ATP-dependent RNA helicase HelY n=1 Tax=Raineyella antarctica TaxID=1577474 RepID=A0A1G6GRR4_9ACTN|nr:DEAD/DEAH box helicase [Raineyella antarctica]SDB84648.1 ATP-dependent RNA helicase HelY [Raineyella antarctica]
MDAAEDLTPAEKYARFRRRQAFPELRDFSDGYTFDFDEYQVEACQAVEGGAGVLVAAPTGAGKTIVGEFAVHLALAQGRKAFYTTPIKALSNQKYNDLVERHGIDKVGLLTGDSSINSDAPVVVMTTEVLRNMMYAGSSTLRGLGFVVMDEVHYLADRFRGPVWEEIIIGLPDSVQLVCLSATVSNAEEFGDWLAEVRGEMEVVVSERRPVPLYQHVLVGNRLMDLFADVAPTADLEDRATSYDVNPALVTIAKDEARTVRDDSRRPRGRSGKGKRTSRAGSDRYGGGAAREHQERSRYRPAHRAEVVRVLAHADLLPAIVFIFSRQGCDAAVRQLQAAHVHLTSPEEEAAILRIAQRHVAGFTDEDLRALGYELFLDGLLRGVAAHHAGVLPALKECVEECFEAGLIKVVFATETLALGINMPARSVLIEKLVKFNGEAHVDITPGEYTQLTGRAGRRGIDVEGHAVVVWQPGMDPRALAGLASKRTYPLRSAFRPTYNMAVNMLNRMPRNQVRTVLELSYAQFQTDRSVVGLARKLARTSGDYDDLAAQAACELGDFMEYARLRDEIHRIETAAAKQDRAVHRDESERLLTALRPGDILRVPSGRSQGWVVVIDNGHISAQEGPRPTVMSMDRQVRRLSLTDFPTLPETIGRVKVPKHFQSRDPSHRHSLAAAFKQRLDQLDSTPPHVRPMGSLPPAQREQIANLRDRLAAHPCHTCPDRELHARWAEKALRAERDARSLEHQVSRRTRSIAERFDKICTVLGSLGYLQAGEGDDLEVTAEGRTLAQIYSEDDLVVAESIRDGAFHGLSAPQLAGVLSVFTYEPRKGDENRPQRMPDLRSQEALDQIRQVARRIALVERDARLESDIDLPTGFARPAHDWCAGEPLADILDETDMSAGDFVRWARLVIDLADQVATAAGPGDLRESCHEVRHRMQRGVVEAVVALPDEDGDEDEDG